MGKGIAAKKRSNLTTTGFLFFLEEKMPISAPRTRVVAAFVVFSSCFPLSPIAKSTISGGQEKCTKTCYVENCDNFGIRYGKYCGVGWTGCPGEQPCDDLDTCCKGHDECVAKKGLTNVKCHEKFKNCIRRAKKSGKAGFSSTCLLEKAAATMTSGMDLAIALSRISTNLDL